MKQFVAKHIKKIYLSLQTLVFGLTFHLLHLQRIRLTSTKVQIMASNA